MLIAGCATGAVNDNKDNTENAVERQEGCNLLTFYWKGTADLETSDVWIWWEGKDGSGYPLTE